MSTTSERLPLNVALDYAARFIKVIDPFCEKRVIVGSCRRRCKTVGDIEIVCVLKEFKIFDDLFTDKYPGLKVNGPRLKRFIYPSMNLQIELYITIIKDYGRILAIRTGSSAFSRFKLATTWNRLGWCGTSDGLRRKKECVKKSTWKIKPEFKVNPTLPPEFKTEEIFFKFLGIDWIPPEKRDWTAQNEDYNYSD